MTSPPTPTIRPDMPQPRRRTRLSVTTRPNRSCIVLGVSLVQNSRAA
eukprot:CAMPEP_0205923620 /NCGR_PEP_ID=MMETSP1325-20131115/16510_1 /ASSEMBLY_ACC=CAM_ASM_000708 /TAXON_ID=236786 /ORGANISM="Florenciella sp., Strain RCC1007" /LENGTH=46 /DNA_ID= /DNA_START= /DNA_END= /DNA_ORIENTATION=